MRSSRLLAAAIVVALSLTACGGTTEPTSTASAPAATTLGDWVQEIGFMDVVTGISTSVNALAADLKALPAGDLQGLANALGKRGPELATQAQNLAAEAANTDAAYENLRAAAVDALNAFATKAGAAAKAKKSEMAGAVGAATTSLNEVTASLAALTDYITAHKSDPVSAAS